VSTPIHPSVQAAANEACKPAVLFSQIRLQGRVSAEKVWTEAEIEALEAEGRELWRILRSELGQGFRVLYFSTMERRLLRPEEDGSTR
jgi:hypothetical protein